ncbi:hypothetical protein BCF33_2479 [Hasllibacter halocynthiae]|uniref:Peptide methionine sulfoxide reductase n=1 Tax=Hasllibacter halocynthiae TaxID=595589 RepID=A0A2T0X3T0_9RHOB|nr:hypothetical protein [Hasllibacter halocynthiae]PRY93599.1 hypothetical protein BCF33_2479 [Hasllibacter halocynthiae]
MTPVEEEIAALWDRVPPGASTGTSGGRRWRAARTVFAGGRSEKIVAETEGSTVSCNLYRLASGPRAFPCEMPAARVAAFLRGWRADQ